MNQPYQQFQNMPQQNQNQYQQNDYQNQFFYQGNCYPSHYNNPQPNSGNWSNSQFQRTIENIINALIHKQPFDIGWASQLCKECYQIFSNVVGNDPIKSTWTSKYSKLLECNLFEALNLYIIFLDLFEQNKSLAFSVSEIKETWNDQYQNLEKHILMKKRGEILGDKFECYDELPPVQKALLPHLFQVICKAEPRKATEIYLNYKSIFDSNDSLQIVFEENETLLDITMVRFNPDPSLYKLIKNSNGISTYFKTKNDQFDAHDESMCKNFLVWGETGNGKSTWINSMANYLLDIKMNDPSRVHLIKEERQSSQAHSQTTKINQYLLKPKANIFKYPVRFIDTPGFGDTRGLSYDQVNAKEIAKYIIQDCPRWHGILFVIKASTPRFTSIEQYIIQQVLSLFGNDSCSNIWGMFTFADNQKPVAQIEIEKSQIPIKLFLNLTTPRFEKIMKTSIGRFLDFIGKWVIKVANISLMQWKQYSLYPWKKQSKWFKWKIKFKRH